jgi:hypothetical protein
VCALLRAKCATVTHPGPYGSLLVLQEVSLAEDNCHGYCHVDHDLLLMLLFYLAIEILDEWRDIGTSGRKYPFKYFMVLLTQTKAFH